MCKYSGNLSDKDGPGMSNSAVTEDNISAVLKNITEDAQYTLESISNVVGISTVDIYQILMKPLKPNKVHARWVTNPSPKRYPEKHEVANCQSSIKNEVLLSF